jgi:Cu(I)/Ag(I) efflux system membrane fusion protein
MKALLVSVLILAAVAGGYLVGRHGASSASNGDAGERKIQFYQSPMHPWIKSEQPGNCTICGMKLVPVYEGDKAMADASGATVRLSSSSINVLNVQTAEVKVTPLRRTIRVAGTIDDDETRHRRLSAYVDGRVEKLGVRYVGAEVREGDLLASIYSPALLATRGDYILLHRQPASPQRERLIRAAQDKLVRMGLSLAQVQKLPTLDQPPDFLEILAPMSGTVVSRNVYEGQYVKEGDVLFEIGDFSQMWFVFRVYERDLPWIERGQTVEITSPATPGKKYTGTIDFIDPNLDPATRSASARVILDNPLVGEEGHMRRELLHKTYADGDIQVETKAVLTVPRSAVLAPGSDPVTYVAHGDGNYEPRKVNLGRVGDGLWEILDGLEEGEKVVTTGNLLIDAQSQLDHGGSPHSHEGEPTKAPTAAAQSALVLKEPLNETQRKTAKDLFAIAGELSDVLAADDLAGFNQRVAALHPAASAVASAFGQAADWVTSTAHLQSSTDLATARKDYYPFSKALAEFAHALRLHDSSFGDVRIFECPMVKDAVPDAPERKGRWVQLKPELRNPFFGSEMLECGVEVKP